MIKKSGENYIKWLSELGKDDVNLVGGKGANLGEMYNSKMPVPQAFVITTRAYQLFLERTGLKDKIKERLKNLDEEDTEKLENVAAEIRKMILGENIPQEIEKEILEAYENISIDKESLRGASGDALAILSKGFEMAFVAVRSSATAEDSSTTSFAGQNETFLNIKGKRDLLEAVKKCWASLFTARSVYYRIKNKLIDKEILIAVIVQVMVNSDKSGVIFSIDPISEKENVVIEAVFGLGEGIVSGKIKPDHYLVSRDMKILETSLADKKIALIRNSSGDTEQVNLTPERSQSQVLTNYEIKKLADYAIQLEEHYKLAQDIEFAIDAGVVYIVQTRPITTLGKKKSEGRKEELGKPILKGLGASPGIASGKVKIIHNLSELSKIKKGDILVTKMTNPDMVVTMQKSAAIITDEGGVTSHAAIISREMGIAAVVGTGEATDILEDGQEVTVDGGEGKVYSGAGVLEEEKVEIKQAVQTRTKIKVIVDLPDYAERASKTGLREVGLTRIEGIIAESGKHPYLYLKQGEVKDYEEVVYSGVSKIAKYFDKLWIRTSDIRSDEYSDLSGAPAKEGNPMLGLHGIRDSLLHPKLLKAELKALHRVAEHGKKLGILMPQLINLEELEKVKELIEQEKMQVELGVMIETPAAVEIIEDLCKVGIGFISFGTNDLTQYTLAIDRNNEDVQYLYDEMNPAVLRQLSRVIKTCKKYEIETSICGQSASTKPMVEFLVKQGIDSISVNADKAYEISVFIKELEERGLRGSLLKEEKVEEAEVEQEDRVEQYDKYVEPRKKSREDKQLTRKQEEKQAEEIMKELKQEKEEKVEEAKEIMEELKQEEFPVFETNIDIFNPAQVEEAKEVMKELKQEREEEKREAKETMERLKEQEIQKEKQAKHVEQSRESWEGKQLIRKEEQGEAEEEIEKEEEEIDEIMEKAGQVEKKYVEEAKEVEQDYEKKADKTITKPIKNKQGKYDVVCSCCKKKAEVPFEPDGIRPVYCQTCYKLGESGRQRLKQKSAERGEEGGEEVEEHFFVEDDDVVGKDSGAGLDIY